MRIQDEITLYNGKVALDDGRHFDLPRTLKKIDRYCDSCFMSSPYDKDNFKKIFYNIIRRPLKASQKAVDIDTKNIIIKATDGSSYIPAWFLNLELKQFMKDFGFAEKLNQITERYPKYGEVIVKDVAGVPEIKVLKNLRWEPSVHIENSPFIHEDHLLSLDELEINGKEKKWETESIKKIKEKAKDSPVKLIKLVERTGYYKESDLIDRGDPEKIIYGMKLMTIVETDNKGNETHFLKLPELTITKQVLKKGNPYRSLSWEEAEGRGIGIGVVEEMFGFQEFYNDINNKERKALEWSSKKFFTTTDPTKNKNLFSQKRTGDIIESRDLKELVMTERNLGQYLNLYNRIENTSNGMTFTHEINTGGNMPSGTPFRLGAVMAGAVDSYFNFKREKLGVFLQGIIMDFVIPSFKKNKRKSHILNFESGGDDLRKLDEMLVNEMMRNAMDKFEKKHGKLPSMGEYEKQRERVEELNKRRSTRFLELPDNFYDSAKINVDIVITGEQENTETDLASLSSLYEILVQKGDPRAEDVLDRALNKAGQNPVSFKKSEPVSSPTGTTELSDLISKQ